MADSARTPQIVQLEGVSNTIKDLQRDGFAGEFTVNLQNGQVQICRIHSFTDPGKPLSRLRELMDSRFYGKYTMNFKPLDNGKSAIDSCEEEETIKV